MENNKLLRKFISPVSFIVIGALARLIPHAPNFTPVAAMALFGGTHLNKKQAFIVPLLIMFISDLFICFDSLEMRIFVYGSFLITVLIGIFLKGRINFKNIILASLISSILFFVITNFAVWAFTPLYLKTFAGLVSCFTMALPFFRNTLLGDLFYTGAIFGSYSLANSWYYKYRLAVTK
ncbi:MAG: hypothetical protein NTV24_04685 [Candidatus Woesebacteria bacterium]|nr:hypothetical protein [Candidatus Woesebacteria bacterium]